MKGLRKLLLFLVSFAVTTWAFHEYLFEDFNHVMILMASVLLHELGHLIPMKAYGLNPSMFFIPLLGAAVYDENISDLNDKQNAFVILGGPILNVALIFVGFVLHWHGNEYGLAMASLNTGLVWINLVPLAILDGKRFFQVVFSSLDEIDDRKVALSLSFIALAVGSWMAVNGKIGIVYFLVVWGVTMESTKDNPSDAYSKKAMKRPTALKLVIVYGLIFFSTLILSTFLPYWAD